MLLRGGNSPVRRLPNDVGVCVDAAMVLCVGPSDASLSDTASALTASST